MAVGLNTAANPTNIAGTTMSLKLSNYNQEMVNVMEKRQHQLSINEYKNSIHDHVVRLDFQLELNPQLNPLQDQVKVLRRSILNSLLDICFRLSWSSSTFSLAVHLFDSYTSKTKIELINCRLIGFCCLWIASKYNENKPKGNILNALIKRSGYETPNIKQTFLKIEFDILKVLNWNLSYPTPELFLDLFLNTSEPNNLERRLGSMFLCDLSLFSSEIISSFSASSIAASSIMLTNFAMLNLRNKHIRQHRFDDLESLILHQVMKLDSSIKLKYLDNNVISHSNNNMVIYNLIHLAKCFVQKRAEEEQQLKLKLDTSYYNSIVTNSNLIDNSNNLLPISPMSSPTNLPNNSFLRCQYSNTHSYNHHQQYHQFSHSRSASANDLDEHSLQQQQYIDNTPESINGKRSRSHSQSIRNILPTPGTTPTASFNWINGNPQSAGSSVNSSNNTATNGNSIGVNSDENLNLKTPQIFTPIQRIPSALLYHQHQLPPHQMLRYNIDSDSKHQGINTRQKYQRTYPVLTRSRTSRLSGYRIDSDNDVDSYLFKRQHM